MNYNNIYKNGKNILTFGKYKNYTYIDVYKQDKKYCNWVLSLKEPKKMLKFQNYLYNKFYNKKKNDIDISNNCINCIICNEIRDKYNNLKCCNNKICNICLIKINSFKCPFCRSDLENKLDFYIKEIKNYIIEKDKKLVEQENLTNTYIYKYNQIYNELEILNEYIRSTI